MESNLSISEILVRYFLMMAVVMIGGFTGLWIIATLALPLFLTAISGYCPLKSMLNKA